MFSASLSNGKPDESVALYSLPCPLYSLPSFSSDGGHLAHVGEIPRHEEFANISQRSINAAIDQFLPRVQAVVESEGGHIEHVHF